MLNIYNDIVKNLEWFIKSKGYKKKTRPFKDIIPAWRNEYIITVFELLPTPPDTPPEYLFITVFTAAMLKKIFNKGLLNVWKYKFKLI